MVSLFGFRTRSAERDREKDEERLLRMREFFEDMVSEIEDERAGLERRYRSQVTDAGFLVEALDNGEASAMAGAREKALSTSIMRCEQRLATLSRQMDQVVLLVRALDQFAGASKDEEAFPPAPTGSP